MRWRTAHKRRRKVERAQERRFRALVDDIVREAAKMAIDRLVYGMARSIITYRGMVPIDVQRLPPDAVVTYHDDDAPAPAA